MSQNAQRTPSGGERSNRYEDYISVAERLGKFYERFPDGRVITHIIEHNLENGFVLMRAEVYRAPDDAQPAASGHAFEVRGESYVNKTSYVENCETSSVGRALALLGFEIKRGFASREEMQKTERPGGDGAGGGGDTRGGHLKGVTTQQGARAGLLKECGELFREMNRRGYQPEWTKITIDTYVNGKFIVKRGADDLSVEQLRKLVSDLTAKRNALPAPASVAEPPARSEEERERAVKIHLIEEYFTESGWDANDQARYLKGVALKVMSLDQLVAVCDDLDIGKTATTTAATGGAR